MKFVTRKWIEVTDLSNEHYSVNNNIRFKTPTLRLDLCDYSDADIVVKEKIDLWADVGKENDKAHKDFAFQNSTPFKSSISKINNKLTDNSEDIDVVMLIYLPVWYSENCFLTSGTLLSYYWD